MFGAGPVTGGSAGGKDYSLSSMMGQLTPHDTAGRGEDKPRGGMEGTATGGGAGGQDRLGAPMLSQGAQDLLQGAGVMQGSEPGNDNKPSTWTQGGPTQGAEEGLGPEEQVSGKEDLSAMQESTLRGLHTLDDSQRAANHRSGDAPGHTQDDDDVYPSPAEGQADASTDEGGIPKSEAGQTAGNNVPLGVQGVAPDQARMQGTDQGTQGWAAEGPAVNLAKAGDLSRDETSMLRGQGILSSRELPGNTEEYPQGLGKDSIDTSGNVDRRMPLPASQPGRQAFGERVPSRSAEAEAADNEVDELREEQSAVPEEEFEKQPTTGGGPLQEGAQAAWDAAAQVADKAKGLLGDGTEE